MAVDPLLLLERARSLGSTATLQQTKSKIQSIENTHRATWQAEEEARYRVEIWDKQSPIGGHPPEVWKARHDYRADGECYLVYIDGHLTYFQPHDPRSAGHVPMDAATAQAVAGEQVAQRVMDAVDARVVEAVLHEIVP